MHACLRMRMFHLTENSKDFIAWCFKLQLLGGITINLYLYQWDVGCAEICKCCKAALCEHKPVQHTTHKLYAMNLIKRKQTIKLHAAQCFCRSQQLHSQSANMEQEGSLPCAQQPSTSPYPEQDESSHITPSH